MGFKGYCILGLILFLWFLILTPFVFSQKSENQNVLTKNSGKNMLFSEGSGSSYLIEYEKLHNSLNQPKPYRDELKARQSPMQNSTGIQPKDKRQNRPFIYNSSKKNLKNTIKKKSLQKMFPTN